LDMKFELALAFLIPCNLIGLIWEVGS